MSTWSLENFEGYRKKWNELILEYQEEVDLHSIVETGSLAYTHKFGPMSRFFWQRIFHVILYLYKLENPGKLLDFGCGLGVVLPYAQKVSGSVCAVDSFITPAQHFQTNMNFSGVKLYNSLKDCVSENERFDTIIALDVLEHIEDLSAKLIELRDMMEPKGRIIVSGPTENWIYKIGRLAAGFHKIYKKIEYTSEGSNPFHHHTIYDIEKLLRACGFKVNSIKTLYPLFPIFRIIVAEKS